jgi:hypothetical protein
MSDHPPPSAPPPSPPPEPPESAHEKGVSGDPLAHAQTVNAANPRVLPAIAGWQWMVMGWALYRKGPLFWLMLTLFMMFCVMILNVVPVLGTLLSFALVPGFGAGFAVAGAWLAAVDIEAIKRHGLAKGLPGGKAITPLVLFDAFKRNMREQLKLGAMYVGALSVILLFLLLADGGEALKMMQGELPAQRPKVTTAMVMRAYFALAGYTVVAGIFWFAPVLITFAKPEDKMTAGKALFFSFFAFWRNLRAFFTYAAAWAVGLMVVGAVLTTLASAISSAPLALIRGMLLPVSVMAMAVMYCTFYASYVTVYAERVK